MVKDRGSKVLLIKPLAWLDDEVERRPCRSRTCDTLIKRYKRFVPECGDK